MKENIKPIKYSLTKKLLISFLLICIVLGLIVAFFSFSYAKKYVRKMLAKTTTACALDVSNMLKNAPFDKFLSGEEKTLYNIHLKAIRNIANTFELKYLYVYLPDEKNNKLIPVFGVEGETGNIIKGFALGESPENLSLRKDVMQLFYSNEKTLVIDVNNEYGHVITSYTVIRDNKGKPIAVTGADISFEEVQNRLMAAVLFSCVLIFSILFIMYLIIVFYIKRVFINPILKLSADMQEFNATGKLDYKQIEKQQHDNEFNVISGLYKIMVMDKKRMEDELSIAKSIQESYLPSVFPPYPDHKEFNIFANMTTAKEVGGDFYDFFFVNSETFIFLVADVSGKGIPAALFMMEAKSLLKNALKTGIPVEDAMTVVNRRLCKNNKNGFFVTVFLAKINLRTGDISYVNAGHTPPLLKRANNKFEYFRIETNVVAGAVDDFNYQVYHDKLFEGDEIFLYTDGVTEAINYEKKLYGELRLLNVLNSIRDIDPEDYITVIKQDMDNFIQNEEQYDDTTMLVFRYNGADKFRVI